jgi:hypothetical protein
VNDRSFLVETERHRQHLLAYTSKLPLPFQGSIGPVRERRSLSANARLWLLHTAASEITGYTKDELHEIALCKHFGYTEVERKDLLTGEILTKRIPLKRSSTRNKKEFAEFMDATEIWYGSEFGVWLPS